MWSEDGWNCCPRDLAGRQTYGPRIRMENATVGRLPFSDMEWLLLFLPIDYIHKEMIKPTNAIYIQILA